MSKIRVNAGGVLIGGGAPVTIQSMTNTKTENTEETVNQILRLEAAGCEIVRSSVYNEDCVKAIPKIIKRIHIPLVADVHFDYRLAIGAIEAGVSKVRMNPGNIGSDTKVFELARAAKANGVPIRVGVNGGSMEKEFLLKYGVTAEGLVESALKHIALLEKAGFYDTVVSIKASNVKKTVDANRMFAERMPYPLHIGITEAGTEDDALVKSAAGLGSLLIDGIGDTMRVSITGDVVSEVKAAERILEAVGLRKSGVEIISCPTCGRTRVDLAEIIKYVREKLPKQGRPVRLAVMGCAVNGPGEAREADIGIAFGSKNAVVFKKGEIGYSGLLPDVIDRFILDAAALMKE